MFDKGKWEQIDSAVLSFFGFVCPSSPPLLTFPPSCIEASCAKSSKIPRRRKLKRPGPSRFGCVSLFRWVPGLVGELRACG